MADLGLGVSGEQAPELGQDQVDDNGKGDQKPDAGGDPAQPGESGKKPPEEKPETPDKPDKPDNPDANIREELVKRFGERSDQELLRELFKSFRSVENEFGKRSAEAKELANLVNQFGGPEALKEALQNPPSKGEPGKPVYPDKVQKLIDSGHLDPDDPRDALIIEQELELDRNRKAGEKTVYKEAVKSFEDGLKQIAKDFEYADMDTIRGLAYSGAFSGLDNDQFWGAVRSVAEKQNAKVIGLVEGKTAEQLQKLKELGKKGLKTGQPGGGKPGDQKPAEVFNEEYDKHFGK